MKRISSNALLTLCAMLATWTLAAAQTDQATAATRGDTARGEALYRARCTACHSVDYNGVGPAHRGVFGRAAGQAAGFSAYSAALKQSGLVWTEQSLERWLSDPEKLVPGQRMGVNVPDATERADLIAYLKSLGARR
jgi:cytochrome c